uniref:Uncharacterized protein n=1 Tax=Trichobilharzia regenti TaxID=157069 RepID=A0AA85JA78_TRIRE|nr:unnamed protein product [Trichobilharzia regenti]
MVYFAYNQIAFVTLLAFAAVNAGEPWSKQDIEAKISATDQLIRGVKPIVDGAEQALQNLKEIADRLSKDNDPRFNDTVACCRQEALEYSNFSQMKQLTRTLFDHKHWTAIEYFNKKLYETQLKQLTGN